jgi:hypothetical protein
MQNNAIGYKAYMLRVMVKSLLTLNFRTTPYEGRRRNKLILIIFSEYMTANVLFLPQVTRIMYASYMYL